jgi:hypothetical protein
MTRHREEERTGKPPPADPPAERGQHNELGYRNVDEQAEHDERGSQGPGPGEQPPREK